jgi:hypothetical protein
LQAEKKCTWKESKKTGKTTCAYGTNILRRRYTRPQLMEQVDRLVQQGWTPDEALDIFLRRHYITGAEGKQQLSPTVGRRPSVGAYEEARARVSRPRPSPRPSARPSPSPSPSPTPSPRPSSRTSRPPTSSARPSLARRPPPTTEYKAPAPIRRPSAAPSTARAPPRSRAPLTRRTASVRKPAPPRPVESPTFEEEEEEGEGEGYDFE